MNRPSPQLSVTGAPPSKRRCYSSSSVDSPRELGQMRHHRETGSGSANFVGSGSGVHFVRTVRRSFASNSAKHATANKPTDEELVPGEDDRLEPPGSLWRYEELRREANGSESGNLGFDDLVLWSKSYFESWHPPFPFLHAPSVLGMLEKISTSGIEALDQAEKVIVRSIMSILLADRRQLPESDKSTIIPSQLVFHTTDEAILALQPLIIKPSSLQNLQAVVTVQVFLISMLRLNAASRIGGLIVRMALHLGLHRCPARFEQFSLSEVDIRKRLFWSIYSFDRFLSQSLGLPLDLKDDDLDVCYHDHEDHRSIVTPQSASYLLLPTFLAKHGRIKGLILELRNKSILHSKFDPDEQARIDAEISRWWNAAQDLVEPMESNLNITLPTRSDHASPVHMKSSHKLLLFVQMHESVILLNRPVITSGYDTSAFAVAMQKCIGASKAIVTSVYRHISTSDIQAGMSNGLAVAPLVWPGFVWLIWQSGLILLYGASEGHYPTEVAQREANRCVAILEYLALRGTLWPKSCAAVIRELQSALTVKDPGNRQTQNISDTTRSVSHHFPVSPGEIGHSEDLVTNGSAHVRIDRTDFRRAPDPHNQHYDSAHGVQRDLTTFEEGQHYNGTHVDLDSPNLSRDFNRMDATTTNAVPGIAFQSHLPDTNSAAVPLSAALVGFESWENVYGGSRALGSYGDQYFDIFQLMDPSYLFSGQMTPYQPSDSR